MSLLHVLILALVQGITEFLPISSSGHLALMPAFAPWPDQGPVIDVAAHVGTLLAVLLYFRRDTVGLAAAGLGTLGIAPARRSALASGHMRLFWALVLATLPVVMAGFALKSIGLIDTLRSASVIAWASIVFGVLLYGADQRGPTELNLDSMKLKPALLIGLAQVLSLIPGASRAGVTMMAARLLGFTRVDAAHFSMLLSIPTILGAGLLTALDLQLAGAPMSLWLDAALVAGLSCVAALAAIHLFLGWLTHASMTLFVVYRVGLGLAVLGAMSLGWIT